MKRIKAFAAISALVLGGLSAASASTLMPGTSAAPTVFNITGTTQLAGEGGLATALTFTDGYIATVISDPNNVFCAGCLDFTYTFADNGKGVNERFSAANFTGFSTAVGYESANQNVSPGSVSRSGDGSVVGFDYTNNNLTSGNTTSILIIETNALYFTTGTFTIQDGSTATIVGLGAYYCASSSGAFFPGSARNRCVRACNVGAASPLSISSVGC